VFTWGGPFAGGRRYSAQLKNTRGKKPLSRVLEKLFTVTTVLPARCVPKENNKTDSGSKARNSVPFQGETAPGVGAWGMGFSSNRVVPAVEGGVGLGGGGGAKGVGIKNGLGGGGGPWGCPTQRCPGRT